MEAERLYLKKLNYLLDTLKTISKLSASATCFEILCRVGNHSEEFENCFSRTISGIEKQFIQTNTKEKNIKFMSISSLKNRKSTDVE